MIYMTNINFDDIIGKKFKTITNDIFLFKSPYELSYCWKK